ncbi:MAG: hypothetical protein GC129_05220 [Proteobacteria bacterium]|nr:hypothetical protein [Pseudomonadota bacterium]
MDHPDKVLENDVDVRLALAGQFATLSHPLGLWVSSRVRPLVHCLSLTHGDVVRLRGWMMARKEGSEFSPTPDTTPQRPCCWLPEGGKMADGQLNVARPQPPLARWRLEFLGGEVFYHMFAFQEEWVPYARFPLEHLREAVNAYREA